MNIFLIVCICGFLFTLGTAAVWFRKRNVLEAAVMGTILFFFNYIFVSMGLFVIDRYSLFRAAFGSMILNAVLGGVAVAVRRRNGMKLRKLIELDLSLKDVIIPIVVCIIALPFVSVKNEIFGMGQDQGVYQVQALYFMNDDNARQKDFEEYHLLETDEQKLSFEYGVKNYCRGYDIQSKDYPDTVYDRNISPVSGIIHGIPTYTSMLAMWGELFGMENMLDIETVFYILTIFLVYFICRNLKLKKASSLCACVMTALSPIVLWVAKSSLTEMFLTVIIAAFLFFITDDERPREKWLSIIPVAVFGCYHVSIYTMLPLFIMIYGGMYFFTREKQYAILTPGVTAGYLISYFMMRQVQPMYTMNNYGSVFVGGINVNNITSAVIAVSAVLIAVSTAYVLIVMKKTEKSAIKGINKRSADNRIFRLFMSAIMIAPALIITYNGICKYGMFTSILGFLFAGGIFVLPLAFFFAVKSPRFFIEKNSRLVMFLSFFYCILVYSAFLRPNIQHYYYYSRYLAPFMPIAVIFGMLTLDRLGRKVIYSSAAAGLICISPYSLFLRNEKDDTRMEWSVLEDVTDVIYDDCCVVIDVDYAAKLWMPLKALTDADVYPEDSKNEKQLEELSKKYARVLRITNKELFGDEYVVCYRNIVNHSEDDLNRSNKYEIMPHRFWQVKDNIYVYSYEKYKLGYSAERDYQYFSGFSAVEGNFCWSAKEKTKIMTKLCPDDYSMKINLGCGIPFDKIGKTEIDVTVYINGIKAGETEFNSSNINSGAEVTVPEELINDGENLIELETELWDTRFANPDDNRMVGIPLESIEFEVIPTLGKE